MKNENTGYTTSAEIMAKEMWQKIKGKYQRCDFEKTIKILKDFSDYSKKYIQKEVLDSYTTEMNVDDFISLVNICNAFDVAGGSMESTFKKQNWQNEKSVDNPKKWS